MKSLQAKLKAEQQQWQKQKSSLIRDIAGLEAKKKAKEELQGTLDNHIRKLHDEHTKIMRTVKECKEANEELAAINKDLLSQKAEKQAEIEALEAKIEDQRAKIKAEAVEQRKKHEEALNQDISDKEAEIRDRNDDIALLNSRINDKKAEINNLKEQAKDAKQSSIIELNELKTEIIDLKQRKSDLTDKVALLETQVKTMNHDKAKIQEKLLELETNHNQFVDYEKRARKILEAKDKELTDREMKIRKDSAMLDNRRSFLPPM